MKRVAIITSLSGQKVSEYLFGDNKPTYSNGGMLGMSEGCQVFVVMTLKGKVNVAVSVSNVINDIKPDAVIMAGFASSLTGALLPGSLMVASHFCYHDVCFGLQKDFGRYPEEPSYYYSDDKIVSGMIDAGITVHQGLLVSGDRLIDGRTSAKKILNHFGKAKAVDMESAAAAQVCHSRGVPFVSIRVIDSVPVMEDKVKALYPHFKKEEEELTGKLLSVLNKTLESMKD